MTKTFNLPAAFLAVIATVTTVVAVHGVAKYERDAVLAAAMAPVVVAGASPVVQDGVVEGRRASV